MTQPVTNNKGSFQDSSALQGKASKPLHQGPVTELIYVNSSVISTATKVDAVASQYFTPKGEANPAVPVILDAASSLYAVTGITQTARGYEAAKKGYTIGDKAGFTTGLLRFFRGPIEVITGAAPAALAGISVAKETQKIPKVVGVLGLFSAASSGVLNVIITISSLINFIQTQAVFSKVNEALKRGTKSAVVELKRMLTIDDSDRKQILDGIFYPKKAGFVQRVAQSVVETLLRHSPKDDAAKKKFQENLEKILRSPSSLEQLDTSEGVAKPLSKKDKAAIDTYLNQHPQTKALSKAAKKRLKDLLSVVYSVELEKVQQRKEAIFARTVGSATRKLIEPVLHKNVSHISQSDLQSIVDSAKKEIKSNQYMNIGCIAACTLSSAVIVLAQVLSGGIVAIVDMAIGFVSTALWLGINSYALYKAYLDQHPTIKDKVIMLLTTIINTALTVVAATLAKTTLNAVIIPAIAIVWTLIALYGIYLWKSESPPAPKLA